MKVLKTIVATAVIVFALTTVAMAGVQHFANDEAGSGQAAQTAASHNTQAAASGSVTLSAQQFAALLRAVQRDGASHVTAMRTQAKARTHTHVRQRSHVHATHADGNGPATTTSHHTTTHDRMRQQTSTHTGTHTGTHHGETHDGGHAGGGCD